MSHIVNPDSQGRKPYQEPSLRVYGDIRSLTQSINKGNIKDAQAAMKSA